MAKPRKPRALCICGHVKSHHPAKPLVSKFGYSAQWCLFVDADDYGWAKDCGCDGWCEPAKPDERLVFGVHRIPRRAAETAPAWSLDAGPNER